jgi:hypothetical protein
MGAGVSVGTSAGDSVGVGGGGSVDSAGGAGSVTAGTATAVRVAVMPGSGVGRRKIVGLGEGAGGAAVSDAWATGPADSSGA